VEGSAEFHPRFRVKKYGALLRLSEQALQNQEVGAMRRLIRRIALTQQELKDRGYASSSPIVKITGYSREASFFLDALEIKVTLPGIRNY